MPQKLSCYVRTLRWRFALTQPEFATLLGISASQLSRIENGKRAPTAWILMACELVFGERGCELFPGLFENVEDEVVRELVRLQKRLDADASERARQKLRLVEQALGRAINNETEFQEV